jgi:predicted Zn-dependent protease with MMP-like domain
MAAAHLPQCFANKSQNVIIIIKQYYKASQLGLDALTIAKNKKENNI